MLSNKEIVRQFYKDGGHKSIAESGLAKQKKEDELNHQFYAGDESAYTQTLETEGKKLQVVFNRVQPYVNSFAGFMAQNRRVPEYFAMAEDEQERKEKTEKASNTLRWVRSNGDADQIETQRDKELAICGYGVYMPYIDYMKNPDGEICFTEITADYWWDPNASQPNLTDRRFEYIKRKMHVDEAIERFGGTEEDYDSARMADKRAYKYYGNGVYNAIAWDWTGDADTDNVFVYEYHWFDIEKVWECENPVLSEEAVNSGLSQHLLMALENWKKLRLDEEEEEDYFELNLRAHNLILTTQQKQDVEEICARFGLTLEAEEIKRRCYYEAVLSGEKVLQKRKAIDQGGFACNVATGNRDKKRKLWTGLVTSLREPAKYANKAVSEFLLILAATSKPGWFYDIRAIGDVERFERDVNRNAKAIPVEGNPAEMLMPKQQSAMPNGYDALYPQFIQALGEVTGFPLEALGMGDLSQPSFETEQQRIKQVMTTLAVYADSITLASKDGARSALYYMRRLAKNAEGRMIPVMDESGERGIVAMYTEMLSGEFIIDIGEAPDTPSKKREQMLTVTALVDKLAMILPPDKAQVAYGLSIEYLPIANAEKAKFRELLMPKQPDPAEMQAQQQQMQMQMQQMQASLRHTQAAAELKAAQADKTRAEKIKVDTETDQKNLENLAMTTHPVNEVNVNI